MNIIFEGVNGSGKTTVIDAFRNKMKNVDQDHEQFQHVGLAILIDIPLFFFMILNGENG